MRHKSSLDYSPLYQVKQFAVILGFMLLLHVFCMHWLEGMSWIDSIWLTLTTATTVGFGDHAPRTTEGRIATIVLIYMGGILMAARIGVLYFDYLLERRMKILQGKWSWKMKGHIVFLNAPAEGADEYFKLAASDLRASECEHSSMSIVIHSDQYGSGLPEEVRKLEVAHVHAETVTKESLKRANIEDAAIIVILAKRQRDDASDSVTFDLVHRLRAMGVKARIVAEVVRPENKKRLREAGADNIIRPVRSYPELVVRSIIAPGSEQVIEELISHHGATSVRYDVAVNAAWNDVQKLFRDHDLGVLIGYVDAEGVQHLSPSSNTAGEMHGLIAVVRNGQSKSSEHIRKLVQAKNHQSLEAV